MHILCSVSQLIAVSVQLKTQLRALKLAADTWLSAHYIYYGIYII